MSDKMFDDINLDELADSHETEEREELRKQVRAVAGRVVAKVKKLAEQGDIESLRALEIGQTVVVNDEEAQALIDGLTRELAEQRKRADTAERELREVRTAANRLGRELQEARSKPDDKSKASQAKKFFSRLNQ